jgi:hypothetical protein
MMRSMAISALLCAWVLVPSKAAAAEPLATVSLDSYVGALRTIDVRIADTRARFLFDTAGGITCITPQLAAELRCEPYGRSSGFRHSGERIDVERCGDMTLVVGDLPLEVEVTVFDILALIGDAPPVGGLVSVHTFARHAFTVDLDGGRLVLESDDSLAERVATMRSLSARFAHQAGGASLDPFVEVAARRGSLWLELDSGNVGRTILAPSAATQLGIEATGESTVTLELIGLGETPLSVRFLEDCIYDGVLGIEMFRGRTITFDPRVGRIWATP